MVLFCLFELDFFFLVCCFHLFGSVLVVGGFFYFVGFLCVTLVGVLWGFLN